MPIRSLRERPLLFLALGIGLVAGTKAGTPNAQEPGPLEQKQLFLSYIRKPDREIRNRSGESMRSFYVARLSELDHSVLDSATVKLFLDLIDKDEDEWVRLEAAFDIAALPISAGMLPKVLTRLEKCRNDSRVNFRIAASQSLLRIAHKRGETNMRAEKTLAGIAQGQGESQWKVMIPLHNAGTMATDPGSGAQIHFADFFKMSLRINAMEDLALANDAFSKKAISELTRDGNKWIRESAQSILVPRRSKRDLGPT